MKRRILSLVLVLCLVMTLMPVAAYAEGATSGSMGEGITWTLDSEGTLTISGTGAIVKNTSSMWQLNAVKKLVIEDGITEIPAQMFVQHNNLTEVVLPDSVKFIGERAFYKCAKLESITLPANGALVEPNIFAETPLDNAGEYVDGALYFQNYLMKTTKEMSNDFVVREGTVAIVYNALYAKAEELTSVKFPSSLKVIGAYVLCDNQLITSIDIPDSVEYIGSCAFKNNVLTEIKLPESLVYIGSQAFISADNVKSISIPDSVTYIGTGAFGYCNTLETVKLPESLTAIYSSTFEGCTALKSITVPDGVKELGDKAFQNCSALEEVNFGGTLSSIGNDAFKGTKIITDACEKDGYFCFGKWLVAASAYELEIPDGTIGLCKGIFSNKCYSEVHIPASVQTFGDRFQFVTDLYYYGTYDQWLELGLKNRVDFSRTTVHFMGEGGHEHDFSYATESVEMSCIAGRSGYTRHTCECGTYYDDNVVPMQHSYGDWTVQTEVSCWEDGVETRKCSVCGKTEIRTTTSPGHQYEDHVCTVCGWNECTFTDIENSGYHDYIVTAAGLGIIKGYPDNTYRPNASVTRGQYLVMLYRLCGEPEYSAENSFNDVSESSPYYDAILWAAENGITNGYSDGSFRPNKVISRAEMATFTFRFLIDPSKLTAEEAEALYASVGFGDEASIAGVFKNPVNAMANLGIIQGFSDGCFHPNATANRGQAATIILRVYVLLTSMTEE